MGDAPGQSIRVVGRYAIHAEIASGGMATVYVGRLMGPVGFSRTVAIKQLHPQFAKAPEFVSMFLDEARIVARVRHPNVIPTLDVVTANGELFLVMEYVQGESLSRLLRTIAEKRERVPPRIACTILSNVLHGLHAAHVATSDRGEPLGIIHRDVSPQNVIVGVDGVTRVLDFGVAKAAGRLHTTQEGQLKGKLPYMAPEQIEGRVSAQTDVYAASVVLWEALTGRRLFGGDQAEVLKKVLFSPIPSPSRFVSDLPQSLEAVTLRGLERDLARRFSTAREMARALETCSGFAPPSEVADWVLTVAGEALAERAAMISDIEASPAPYGPDSPRPGSARPPPAESSSAEGRSAKGATPSVAAEAAAAVSTKEPTSQLSAISSFSKPNAVGLLRNEPWIRIGVVASLGVAAVVAGTATVVWNRSDGSSSASPPERAAVATETAEPDRGTGTEEPSDGGAVPGASTRADVAVSKSAAGQAPIKARGAPKGSAASKSAVAPKKSGGIEGAIDTRH